MASKKQKGFFELSAMDVVMLDRIVFKFRLQLVPVFIYFLFFLGLLWLLPESSQILLGIVLFLFLFLFVLFLLLLFFFYLLFFAFLNIFLAFILLLF